MVNLDHCLKEIDCNFRDYVIFIIFTIHEHVTYFEAQYSILIDRFILMKSLLFKFNTSNELPQKMYPSVSFLTARNA